MGWGNSIPVLPEGENHQFSLFLKNVGKTFYHTMKGRWSHSRLVS